MNFARNTGNIIRNFSLGMVRNHGHPGGVPGLNLPIDPNSGKYKITLIFTLYFGIAFGAPWFVVRHQLVRK